MSMLVFWAPKNSELKMEVVCSSKMMVFIYKLPRPLPANINFSAQKLDQHYVTAGYLLNLTLVISYNQ
jgi:hypothetical protein